MEHCSDVADGMRLAFADSGSRALPQACCGLRRLVSLALVCQLAACSLLLTPDADQCSVDADCETLGIYGSCRIGVCVPESSSRSNSSRSDPERSGCGPEADCGGARGQTCWMERECVATDLIEPFICSHTAPVREDVATLALRVQVIGSMQTPADLVVSACQTADIDCTSPVVQQKDANQSGELRLEIPFDFAGYLEFQASDAVPSYYFTNRPLHDLKEVLTILMITPELVRAGAMLTGAPAGLDQNNFVGVQMRNCAGAAVGGVQFETSKPDIVPLYIVNGLPTPDATVTAYDPVSQMAVGGFLNVAPGFVLVKARLGNSGPIVGQLLVNIRTDSLTQLDIYP